MDSTFKFSGIATALVTSFTAEGELDLEGIKTNVNYLIEKGVWGLVVCGSTGEAAALARDERVKVIETSVAIANGRVKIIAGAGAPSTSETIQLCREAKQAGGDAALVITPFYLIPTQEGLLHHYKAIDKEVDLPIIAYNIPAHTNVDIDIDTLEKLSELKNIAGLKESSGRGWYVAEAIARVGNKIAIIEGGDDVLFPSLCMGASGAIIALGNLAPVELVAMFNAISAGNFDQAREIYFQILPIARAIAVSVNFPSAVKAGVEMLGRPAGPTRSPILPLTSKEHDQIHQALIASKLL